MREVSVVPPSRLMGLLEQVSVSVAISAKFSSHHNSINSDMLSGELWLCCYNPSSLFQTVYEDTAEFRSALSRNDHRDVDQ